MTKVLVTSHIGRDLIQSANMFKTADTAIWEYVVNSIQYVTSGTSPVINIQINNKDKSILIEDNGRGMDSEGLNNFFKMHGENLDRKSGKLGRGKFGTGKSAAFGIAKKLTISSICNSRRNTITLHKNDIENSDGGEIPVEPIESNVFVKGADNGTKIKIEEIFQKIDESKIIKKIEKHLQSYRNLSPEISVGSHICKYKEPNYEDKFTYSPESELQNYLGDVTLEIKVAQIRLKPDERGILVSSGMGNLVAIEDAGVCSKEMGEYLFGEIDVPNLDSDNYEMEAYNSSRDMKLRPEHPVSLALNTFIGTKLEEVRKNLVRKKRESMKSEESKRLKEQADKIAELLNKDFKEFNDKILETRSSTSNFGKSFLKPSLEKNDGDDGWVSGLEERGNLDKQVIPETDPTPPNPTPTSSTSTENNEGNIDVSGNTSLDPASSNKKSRKPKGGFSVEYEHLGKGADRAIYTADRGVFTINLDHAVVQSAATNLGIDDIGFQRLSHEIIFAEYSLALANMAAVDDPDIPADDVIYDARETLNRISAKSAILYIGYNKK